MSTEREKDVAELGRVVQRNVQETVRFYGAVADKLGMHVTDLHCLGALHDMGRATAGDLAVRLGLTTGAITRVIDRLVARGYVRRVADPTDRRRVVVEVEHAADAEVGAEFAGMGAFLERIAAALTDEQLRTLLRFLREGIEATRRETERLRAEGKPHAARRSAINSE